MRSWQYLLNLSSILYLLHWAALRYCLVDAAFLLPQHETSKACFISSSSRLLAAYGAGDRFENDGKDDLGDVQIPSTGVSVNDEMESSEQERFETKLVPITGMKEVAAQLVTTTTLRGSFEPVRYLISLSKKLPPQTQPTTATENQQRVFVMMDIPPYSPELVSQMKSYMGPQSHLAAILVTSRDAIHYDDAPAVYKLRRTDLGLWKKAFPGLQIIAYRLDIPRDCREYVTQVLDGYGPFALDESALMQLTTNNNNNNNNNNNSSSSSKNATLFTETGTPFTHKEWDHDVAQDILRGRKALHEDNATVADEYSPAAIRAKEEGKRILAVFTPGHSFGSVSYVFPEIGVCCSGFTIPVEDTRYDENPGMGRTGPALDCRGYITTSRGGMDKQTESARHLVKTYSDRFNAVFASRGDPLVLDSDSEEERREALLDIINQYDKIGKIYERLGITSSY